MIRLIAALALCVGFLGVGTGCEVRSDRGYGYYYHNDHAFHDRHFVDRHWDGHEHGPRGYARDY